ncbi:Gag Polyprotein [Plakobranchus ocellatus]|uniref:Gag Polyprotein n=1 Tax=Plakobranchus ocellatus TaxID=259542 RepID=A0AAV4BLU5_9GAST|nr:Gag Polyprotein [Plakobranchus ocellatus]
MFKTDVNLSVNKIKKNRGSDNAQRRKQAVNQPKARPTSYRQARSKTNQCPRCGYEHPPRSCPAYGKTCGACGKQNHFNSQCQTKTGERPTHQKQPHKKPKQKVYNVHEDDDSGTESDMDDKHFFVAAIGADKKGKKTVIQNNELFVETTINTMRVKLKVDTCSQANILPLNLYRKLNKVETIKIKKFKLKLTSYSGDKMEVVGKCTLYVMDTPLLFYVIDTREDPILGLRASQTLNLIKVMEIHPEQKDGVYKQFPDVFEGI